MSTYSRPHLCAAARRGFTLVELLVVVTILGMVVTLVSISFESLVPGERLNTSIRILSADLMKARAEAISHGMEYRIEYDLANERYRIATPFRVGGGRIVTEDDPNDEMHRFYTAWEKMRPGVEIKSVYIGGVEYTEGQAFIRFDALGSASDHLVILSQPEYGSTFTLEVMALTGLVRMHDGEFFRQPPDDGDFQ